MKKETYAAGPRQWKRPHELRLCGGHGDHGGRRLFKRACQLTCPFAARVCSFPSSFVNVTSPTSISKSTHQSLSQTISLTLYFVL